MSHEASVLVAISSETVERYIVQGVLGCPVCGAEYPIVDGVTYFEPRDEARDNAITGDPHPLAAGDAVDAGDAVLALAAQLAVREGRGVYAMAGYDVDLALALRRIVPTRLIVMNPIDRSRAYARMAPALGGAPAGIVCVREGSALPFATASLDAIALAPHQSARLPQCARTLRTGARLVARVSEALPAGFRELVRDGSVWVAERQAIEGDAIASAPVQLRRA